MKGTRLFGTWSLVLSSLIIFLELVGYFIFEKNPSYCDHCSRYGKTEKLRFWNPSHETFKATKYCKKEKVCFSVQYTFDAFGRRVHSFENKSSQDNPVALLGDSFVFGYGLQDSETLAFYLHKSLKRRIYNYGHSGADLNLIYALFNKEILKSQLPKSTDMVLMIPQIVLYRNLPSSNYIHNFKWPHCRMIKNIWKCFDSAWSAYPWQAKILYLFEKLKKVSFFLKAIDGRMSFYSMEEHVRISGVYLRKIKEKYEEQFDGKLKIFAHPHGPFDAHEKRILQNEVEVHYLPIGKGNNLCDCDQHPDASFNKTLSTELAKVLN